MIRQLTEMGITQASHFSPYLAIFSTWLLAIVSTTDHQLKSPISYFEFNNTDDYGSDSAAPLNLPRRHAPSGAYAHSYASINFFNSPRHRYPDVFTSFPSRQSSAFHRNFPEIDHLPLRRPTHFQRGGFSGDFSAEQNGFSDLSGSPFPTFPRVGLQSSAFSAPDTPPRGAGCMAPAAPCVPSKYRTLDGSCNNLQFPTWGAANTKYARLVGSRYADGIRAPPTSVSLQPLPLSRLVSIVMFPDQPIDDPLWTLVTMSWGQIITHDMSMAMGTTQAKRHSTRCCDDNGQLRSNNNPNCFPIVLPEDDPVFSRFRRMCMNFVRTTTDIDTGCNPGLQPAEQLVAVTHWMDASLVYGNTRQLSDALRERAGGRLIVQYLLQRPFPPTAPNKTAVCDLPDEREPCYQFGDRRSNQNPQLTLLQIILLREHNRLANILSQVNPHWDDETLFQEARRILIAEYQHINYYEYLPIILGKDNMLKYGLIYNQRGYTRDYKDYVDPSVLNGHATAAFRYFHSAIQGRFQLIGEGREILDSVRLSDFFNRPVILETGNNFDHLTRGLSTQSEEAVDPFLTSEITDFLFRAGRPFGRDLRAIDIQRGRDHGLGSYNDYREFCGLRRANSFREFSDFIDPERVEKLSVLYGHPDDVDFVVGGSLEGHVAGTLSGPTFLCIMLEQFYRTRVSDRYFFEAGNQVGSFTPEQLNEIRKSSVARLFCDNGDDIKTMQPSAFLKLSNTNRLVPCDDYASIPALDLNHWKEIPAPLQAYSDEISGIADYKK